MIHKRTLFSQWSPSVPKGRAMPYSDHFEMSATQRTPRECAMLGWQVPLFLVILLKGDACIYIYIYVFIHHIFYSTQVTLVAGLQHHL